MASGTINKMSPDMFVFKEFTKNFSLNQYSHIELSINIALSGYTPYALRAVSVDNQYISIYTMNIADGTFYMDIKNRENAAQTGTALIRIAYVKAPVTEITA